MTMSEDLRSESEVPPQAGGDDGALAEEPTGPADVETFAAESAAAEGLPVAPPEDWRERWLRAEAELQNYRRRAGRDRDEAVRHAEDRLLLDMVTVLDDLERALATLSGESAAANWAQGIALTAQGMRDALGRAGVEPVASVGLPFDPLVHEAMLEVDAPAGISPGAVAQEVLRGYRRGERALRAARVVVARAPQDGG